MRKMIFEKLNKLESIKHRAEKEKERLKLNNDALDNYLNQINCEILELRTKVLKGAKK